MQVIRRKKDRKCTSGGFTLVELSLAIAFIAVLSIIMVLIITNSISAYHRGLTLNSINTVGMDVVDNMREAVQGSPGQSVVDECGIVYGDTTNGKGKDCADDKAMSFVSVTRKAKVKIKPTGDEFTAPVYGAFCTGNYSYIWNSGYYFNSSDYEVQGVGRATLKYRVGDPAERKELNRAFKLLRVEDTHRAVCKAAAGVADGNYLKSSENLSTNTFDIACSGISNPENWPVEVCDVISEDPIDILETSENNLALYDLAVATAADNGNVDSMFYAVSFILGTVQGGINITSDGDYCTTPEGYGAAVENFDYCAINKFNFAAQATGGRK